MIRGELAGSLAELRPVPKVIQGERAGSLALAEARTQGGTGGTRRFPCIGSGVRSKLLYLVLSAVLPASSLTLASSLTTTDGCPIRRWHSVFFTANDT